MTDFLEQLLSRSYEPAAAIRPRPSARFESLAGGRIPAGESGMGEEEARPLPPAVDAARTRRDFVEGPPAKPDVVESRPSHLLLRDEPVEPAPPRPAGLFRERPARADRDESDAARRRPTPEIRSEPLPSGGRPALVSGEDAGRPEHPAPPEDGSDRPAPVVVQNILSRQGLEAQGEARLSRPAAERPAPPPRQTTVRVNIGRIEISAPPAPPLPSSRSAAERRPPSVLKPARSLDDYLSRKSGGGK